MARTRPRLIGLLLAAGAGRRAGGPKALRVDPDGVSWLVRSVDVLLDTACDVVVVVLGCEIPAARALLPAELTASGRVVVVEAADWAVGVGRSLLAGLAAVEAVGADAVVVHLVDLPDVGGAVVLRVLSAAGTDSRVLARASYGGRPGHPVLIGLDHLGPLRRSLSTREPDWADAGAQAYLQAHEALLVECGDLASGQDQDLPC